MDKFGWEDVRKLLQHVLAESINLLVAEAEHVQIDAPSVSHLVRTSRASELGIGGESSLHVSRHVNLGDDGDVSLACVLHDFASLILSVESAVFSLVVHHRVESDDGARTLRSNARKTRILLYLDSPSLIVGEMPVKDVHVMHSHEVKIFLDEVHGEEVARAVEHHAAITEAWLVCYSNRAQLYVVRFADGHRLAQRLNAVEHALRRTAGNDDAFLVHADAISLFAHLAVRAECDGVFLRLA